MRGEALAVLVAVLIADLRFLDAQSLKDKRQRLSSVVARLRSRFPVSVAETAFHDLWQRGRIGVALATTDAGLAQSMMDRIRNQIGTDGEVELLDSRVELIDIEEGST
ncbi:MAG TPA: DUF503 domain-containing protein [Candidatus Deferrimicrobiaceae bacterium]|jgi:hypothetical protein